MKIHEVIIKPSSGFGTPLMGDTIFGHFCWQAAYNAHLLNGGLDRWIACYEKKPFTVFSSAWPRFSSEKVRYALRRPALPNAFLYPKQIGLEKRKMIAERKELQKKRWMLVGPDLLIRMNPAAYVTDQELAELMRKASSSSDAACAPGNDPGQFVIDFDQPHNSINRLTETTGEGGFAPFAETASFYYPGTELAVFVLIDEEATNINRVVEGLTKIAKFGYGRNASTGLGRFEVLGNNELNLSTPQSSNACYTLAPCVPEKGVFADFSFTPFVRFGKHGDVLVQSGKPFKNPVLMAGEGAVFFTKDSDTFEKPYFGKAVLNTSKALPASVVQGYTPYLPLRVEGIK